MLASLRTGMCALMIVAVGSVATPALAEDPKTQGESSAQAAFDPSSLHATYKYVGGEKQKQKIQAAIKAGIEGLPSGLHSLAEKRIGKTQQAWPTIRVDIEGDDIRVERGPEKPVHTTAAKPKFVVTNRYGERYTFRQQLKGRTLHQSVKGLGNHTELRYRFNEDGSKLTFKITIDADLLPNPISYSLTYARVD